jgi:Cu+-exporting ATPase
MAIDPVCNMDVEIENNELQSTYAGKKFFFCSEECKNEFDDRPEEYASSTAAA